MNRVIQKIIPDFQAGNERDLRFVISAKSPCVAIVAYNKESQEMIFHALTKADLGVAIGKTNRFSIEDAVRDDFIVDGAMMNKKVLVGTNNPQILRRIYGILSELDPTFIPATALSACNTI